MRPSIVGAAFLIAGAGAASVAALDTTGNNIALTGSEILRDVTLDVLGACSAASGAMITYRGAGSGLGEAQMWLDDQQLTPMSRAMKSSEICAQPTVSGIYGGTTAGHCGTFTDQASCVAFAVQGATACVWDGAACAPDPLLASHLSAALLVGLDGVTMVANTTNACATSTQNGFGAALMSVTSDGTTAGAAVTDCAGCDLGTSTYTFTDTFDALKLLYLGLHHDSPTTPTYACDSPARRTLIRQWRNVFSTDCPTGDANCPTGLTHAWRFGDLSGTTDAFLSILAGGELPKKGTSKVGIGTPAVVSVAPSSKMNPFCNSADANSTTSPPLVSRGGSSDDSDLDPVRTNCVVNGGAVTDDVCEGSKTPPGPPKFRGDLGVVLPVLLPDMIWSHPEAYNAVNGTTSACSGSCTPVTISKGNQSVGLPCPDGVVNVGGQCLMPFKVTSAGNDPRCYSIFSIKCSDTPGNPDGRMYNLPLIVPFTDVPLAQQGPNPFQYAVDGSRKPISAAYYRILESHHAPTSSGPCLENDASSQIGCLVDSDPCSVGFASRAAAATFPGGSRVVNKALLVGGVSPFASGADPDANVEALYTGGGTLYPMSRRLYVASFYGFGTLKGGEAALAACFATNHIVNPAVTNHGLVAVPGGSVKCLDYDESSPVLSTPPPPNTPGSGNQAFPGCGFSTNVDACASVTISP